MGSCLTIAVAISIENCSQQKQFNGKVFLQFILSSFFKKTKNRFKPTIKAYFFPTKTRPNYIQNEWLDEGKCSFSLKI